MNEELHALVDLYAISALEADESAAFEVHLSSCEQCQDDLRATKELLGDLDRDIEIEPPKGLRAQVLDEIENTPQQDVEWSAEPLDDNDVVVDLTKRTGRNSAPLLLASVAAALMFVVVSAVVLLSMRSSAGFDSVASTPDALTVELVGEVSGSVTVAWSESEGQLAVMANGLEALSEDLTYEVWFFEQGQPVRAGIFVPNNDGVVDFVGDFAGDPSLWAITVEPAGGVDVPTTTPIFVGEL